MTFCHLSGARVSRTIATRKDCEEVTRVYMMMRGKDGALEAAHKPGNLEELKQSWARLYKDAGWECDRFMQALLVSAEADDLYSTPLVEVHLPQASWAEGRVALVGVSAYRQTADGFGTTLAPTCCQARSRTCTRKTGRHQQEPWCKVRRTTRTPFGRLRRQRMGVRPCART